ncbi:ATP-binding protein [Agrococcus terreus]|uniref:Histidine kinase/HSP90-like ATPase domain-containing protein n=1 Tax=Agrococcus terreus TaxID=574649 RepID=A0ABQ2KHF7_9MICO|nr:ATP-binding protein [Agrococcus terreus]GGN81797.1 hypothetical protein GCM10010968_10910 [Agrococcus terreus]
MATDAHATTLEGPADLRLVEQVLDALERLYEAADDVAADDRVLFQLAVSEVATNIAEHGLPPGSVRVRVRLEVAPERLAASFVDTARPASVDLDEAEMAAPLEESGRGLAMAVAALDEFTHERSGGNTWSLVRRRGAA